MEAGSLQLKIVGVAPSEFEVENILWIEAEIHARGE